MLFVAIVSAVYATVEEDSNCSIVRTFVIAVLAHFLRLSRAVSNSPSIELALLHRRSLSEGRPTCGDCVERGSSR